MRRALAIICAAVVGGVAVAAAQAETQLEANRAAARHDARQLLGRLRLPGDVTRIRSGPRWAEQMAALAGSGPNSAADRMWWRTPADPQAIIDFVTAHPPTGGDGDGTGSGQNNVTGVSTLTAEFSWPPVGPRLYDRTLTVTVVTPPHGASFVVAQSQSFWIVPRPASELVPAGVRVVDVRLRVGSGPGGRTHERTHTYALTGPERVAGIVREFNALQTMQSVGASCVLMMPHEPRLTVTFRSGPAQAPLARAQVNVYPGRHGASGWNSCDPIQFWLRGRRQTPLTSTTWVSQIGRLVGANIS